jgi:16S rRNA (guanine527-N7)-methyltransferase
MGKLAEAASELGILLTLDQLERFAVYRDMLLAWNERLNLTAIRDGEEVEIRHFLDSLSCTLVTGDLSGRRLIDVGTGAGFPGLPLKLLFPQLQLTLVESIAKKTAFLRAVVEELELNEVTILAERAEVIGHWPEHRAQYDWAVARAVAELRTLAEYLLPFCRLGGAALAQKGPGAVEEMPRAVAAIAELGGGPPSLAPAPSGSGSRYLVVVIKEQLTPDRYPRRSGLPAKRPL